jgi:hypothetical protein
MKKILGKLFNNSKRYFPLYTCLILWVCFFVPSFLGIEKAYGEPIFSVTSDNEPLNEILVKISKSTGYKIEITKSWEDKPVTVSLKKITLEKGLREIMRMTGEPNYAVVINESIKKVEIRIFDGSSPGQIKGGGAYVGTRYDFRKREKAAAERDLVDVSRPVPGNPEDPPEIDIAPPEIDIRHPEMGIIPPE